MKKIEETYYPENADVPALNKAASVSGGDPEHSTIRRVASGRYQGIPLPEHSNPMHLEKPMTTMPYKKMPMKGKMKKKMKDMGD